MGEVLVWAGAGGPPAMCHLPFSVELSRHKGGPSIGFVFSSRAVGCPSKGIRGISGQIQSKAD